MGKPGVSTLSREDQARVRAGLKMGRSISELARLVGTSRDKVRWLARRHGLAVRPAKAHVCSCGVLVKSHHPREVVE